MYLIKIKLIVKYYYNLKWMFSILLCFKNNLSLWHNAEFSASLLQSSVSHDLSEIISIYWFAAQETFPIIINVKNSCAAYFLMETVIHFFPGFNIYLLFIF